MGSHDVCALHRRTITRIIMCNECGLKYIILDEGPTSCFVFTGIQKYVVNKQIIHLHFQILPLVPLNAIALIDNRIRVKLVQFLVDCSGEF